LNRIFRRENGRRGCKKSEFEKEDELIDCMVFSDGKVSEEDDLIDLDEEHFENMQARI